MKSEELKERIQELGGEVREAKDRLQEFQGWHRAALRAAAQGSGVAVRARGELAEEVTQAETRLNELKTALEAAENELDQVEIEEYQAHVLSTTNKEEKV
jgi:hypothetical protein